MNILFATTSLPHGQTTGGKIASMAFVEAMRKAGHMVQVFGFARTESFVPNGSTEAGIRAVESASAGWVKYGWLARSFLRGAPYICEKFRSPAYLNHLHTAARLGKADVLVIDHAQMGWLLPFAGQLARKTVLIAHNHEAALYRAEAARQKSGIKRALLARDSALVDILEHCLADQVDQVWTLSGSESSDFAAMTRGHKIYLMPLAGRLLPVRPPNHPIRYDIGLLGTWSWDVNGQGLDWFVHRVMPLLPQLVQVRVAGRGSERVNGLQPNLVGMGFIEDPVQFMHEARVLAVPTIAGAGIQLKTIEAIASGTPSVSTSLGVRGLDDLPTFVSIADEPNDFAAALLRQMALPAPLPELASRWAQGRRDRFEREVAQQLARLQTISHAVATSPMEPA